MRGFVGRRWEKGEGFALGKRACICSAAKTVRRPSGALWRSARAAKAGETYDGRRPRWVETRLAEVATLDCLGSELEDEPLEVHWMRLPAREKIDVDHKFEPARKAPPKSR